jgi:hypothetical protein
MRHIVSDEMGVQNGKKRPWILPEQLWAEGLWEGIKAALPEYLEREKVQRHKGCHNLKSSWMLCANLYFPFRDDLPRLASFLRKQVDSSIETIDRIELEYAEEGQLRPSKLLGEPEGNRGANQTSPDMAFIVNGGKGLILTENKYTEHSFYECSGRKYSPHPEKCLDIQGVLDDLDNTCYQLHWEKDGRPNRRYWDYLKISDDGKRVLKRCPAAYSGCQLFRQQALAEGIAQAGKYDVVISCVAYDGCNDTLNKCLKPTGLPHFSDWGKLFKGKARFAAFTHQQWVQWVRDSQNNGQWGQWLDYIRKRYGY